MESNERDFAIVEKMIAYCCEIEEAHEVFHTSYVEFIENSVYKNAVCLCIMQIGELSNHLSENFKEKHSNIPWKQIRGMRNVVAHEYGNIDTATVWETVLEDIPEIKRFCESILGENQSPDITLSI